MLTGFQPTGDLFLSHPPERAHGKPGLCPCTHMCSLCTCCQHKHRDILHLDMNTPCALTPLQVIISTMGATSPLHWVHTHPSQSHTSKAHGLCIDRLGPQITAWPPLPQQGESWQSLISAHMKQLPIIWNSYASKSEDSLSPSFQAWLEQSEAVSTNDVTAPVRSPDGLQMPHQP